MNRTFKNRSGLVLVALFVTVAIVVSACTFSPRDAGKNFPNPGLPPDMTNFKAALLNTVEKPWAAQYTLQNAAVLSKAQMILDKEKLFTSLTIGGIAVELYADFGTGQITACALATNVLVGCFPFDASSELGKADGKFNPTTAIDGLLELIGVAGSSITNDEIVGAAAQCFNAPETKISLVINLCIADNGGILSYSNGTVRMTATSYTNNIDPSKLIPSTGGLAASLGLG